MNDYTFKTRLLELAVHKLLSWAYFEFMLVWKPSAYQSKVSRGLNLAFLKMVLQQHIQLCALGTKLDQGQCLTQGSTRPVTFKHIFFKVKEAFRDQMLDTMQTYTAFLNYSFHPIDPIMLIRHSQLAV